MMDYKVAINGFGRVGRCILRAYYQRGLNQQFALSHINEVADLESISYLLRYDSTYGRFNGQVKQRQDHRLQVNQDIINISHQAHYSQLDWHTNQIDLVLECTGNITSKQQALAHIQAGAKQVLLSNPADKNVDFTLIYGFNQAQMNGSEQIISNGSCSTNCLIPILDIIDKQWGIEAGTTTTVHSAMNDQPMIDAYNSELRLARAAGISMVPVNTGLAQGVARLMPHLEGKFESSHIRVPTQNVSLLDVNLQLKSKTDRQSINDLLQFHANTTYSAILGVSNEAHASIDFNQDARSAVVDLTQTRVSGQYLLKLLIWFDNEWGFANRMLDSALYLQQLSSSKQAVK